MGSAVRRDHLDDGKVECAGELEIPLVMGRNRHDRARAVPPEHVIGDPDGDPRARGGIHRVSAGEHPRLFPGVVDAFLLRFFGGAAEVFSFAATTGELIGPGPKHYVSVPVLAPAGALTTVTGVFIAHRACTITGGKLVFLAYPSSAASDYTFALTNYDLSATADDNLLSTATITLDAGVAKTATDLVLTVTGADLVLAAGDNIRATIICANADGVAGTGGVLTLEYTLG